MAYTVKQLAQISGVSIRTLHFYDEIDLLKPASIGENNYRYYGKEELLLLQQILYFRELGLELKQIQIILKQSDFDKLEALKLHKRTLEAKSRRVLELIKTINRKATKHAGLTYSFGSLKAFFKTSSAAPSGARTV